MHYSHDSYSNLSRGADWGNNGPSKSVWRGVSVKGWGDFENRCDMQGVGRGMKNSSIHLHASFMQRNTFQEFWLKFNFSEKATKICAICLGLMVLTFTLRQNHEAEKLNFNGVLS